MKTNKRNWIWFRIHCCNEYVDVMPAGLSIAACFSAAIVTALVIVSIVALLDVHAPAGISMALSPILVQKRNLLTAKQKELHEYMESAKKNDSYDPESTLKITGQKFAEEVRTKNKELADIGAEVQNLAELDRVESELKAAGFGGEQRQQQRHPDEEGRDKKRIKSIGELFVESTAYKGRPANIEGAWGPSAVLVDHPSIKQMVDASRGIKTDMTRATGWDPETVDSGLIVLNAQRPVQLLDLIPKIPTNRDTYVFMKESTFTNNAGEIAEASATTYGAAALVYTRTSQAVEKVAVYLPVSEEQLEDSAEAAALINQRLPFMVMQKLDSQAINGNGSTPNLQGVLTATGIQSQARGSDPEMDAIHRGITLSRVTGRAMPNAIAMHSDNWQYIRLMRTNGGTYILGNPGDNVQPRLFGLPVVFNEALSAGTAVVGDFTNYCLMAEKRGITVDVGWVNTDFIRGMKAVRATIRVALVWTRGEAFVKVTSLQS